MENVWKWKCGISITSAVFALSLLGHFFQMHNNPVEGRSVVFASFAINSMVYILAYRSMRLPVYRMNKLTDNKPPNWAVLAGLLIALIAFWIPVLDQTNRPKTTVRMHSVQPAIATQVRG